MSWVGAREAAKAPPVGRAAGQGLIRIDDCLRQAARRLKQLAQQIEKLRVGQIVGEGVQPTLNRLSKAISRMIGKSASN